MFTARSDGEQRQVCITEVQTAAKGEQEDRKMHCVSPGQTKQPANPPSQRRQVINDHALSKKKKLPRVFDSLMLTNIAPFPPHHGKAREAAAAEPRSCCNTSIILTMFSAQSFRARTCPLDHRGPIRRTQDFFLQANTERC